MLMLCTCLQSVDTNTNVRWVWNGYAEAGRVFFMGWDFMVHMTTNTLEKQGIHFYGEELEEWIRPSKLMKGKNMEFWMRIFEDKVFIQRRYIKRHESHVNSTWCMEHTTIYDLEHFQRWNMHEVLYTRRFFRPHGKRVVHPQPKWCRSPTFQMHHVGPVWLWSRLM